MNFGKRLHGTVAGKIGNLAQLSNVCAKTCNIYFTFGRKTFQVLQ